MDVNQYLRRIQYSDNVQNSIAVLNELQRCHLLNIPFENLDIHYANPIKLDVNRFFIKIVKNKRGGFCYELNGLFYELLVQLGFKVKRISARVFSSKTNDYGAEFDHLAIIVEIDGKAYLSDVGFGEFTLQSLALRPNIVQEDSRGKFIIEPYEKDYYKVSKLDKEKTQVQYIFSLTERRIEEFEEMCQYHQTSPNSHFTQKRLISQAQENGRTTITGNILKITEKEETILEKQIKDESTFIKCLEKYFGIMEGNLKAQNTSHE